MNKKTQNTLFDSNALNFIAANGKTGTGLVGFEPTTAGLKGQCATWLRYRPQARYHKLYNLVFTDFMKNWKL